MRTKPRTLARKPVDVRRRCQWVSIAAEHITRMIVGQDEKKIHSTYVRSVR